MTSLKNDTQHVPEWLGPQMAQHFFWQRTLVSLLSWVSSQRVVPLPKFRLFNLLPFESNTASIGQSAVAKPFAPTVVYVSVFQLNQALLVVAICQQ